MGEVVRWKFEEVTTGDIYFVDINPNTMESWLSARSITWGKWDKRMSGIASRAQPVDWNFSGIIKSESHHDALIAWQQRPGKLRITDHLGRTFEVMVQGLDLVDRRATGNNMWRFQYTFNCLLLRRIA